MVVIALFLVGLLVGAWLGIYSLALLEIVFAMVAALSSWRAGVEAAMVGTCVAVLAPSAGFVTAIVASYLFRSSAHESRGGSEMFRRHGNHGFLRSSRHH